MDLPDTGWSWHGEGFGIYLSLHRRQIELALQARRVVLGPMAGAPAMPLIRRTGAAQTGISERLAKIEAGFRRGRGKAQLAVASSIVVGWANEADEAGSRIDA